MNKKLLMGICLICWAGSAMACDACGTAFVSGYVGIMPQFTRHFVGMKYQFRYFSSTSVGDPDGKIANREFYHSWNIWGRISPHKRVQVMVNVPINYFIQQDQGNVRELFGPGDVWTLCQYQLVRSKDSSITRYRHSLMLGGGIKLPTGRYNSYDQIGFYDRSMQSGTGSWDFLLSANYTIRWKGWGMNLESNGRISTFNPDNYLYGHTMSGAIKGFYWGESISLSYVLSTGAQYDFRHQDQYLHQWLPNTGGHTILATASADLYVKKFSIGVDIKIPVYSQLAGGLVHPGLQVSSQFLFMF